MPELKRFLIEGPDIFILKTTKKNAKGINYKYCKVLNRMDGYEYFTECPKVDGIPPMTEATGILP